MKWRLIGVGAVPSTPVESIIYTKIRTGRCRQARGKKTVLCPPTLKYGSQTSNYP